MTRPPADSDAVATRATGFALVRIDGREDAMPLAYADPAWQDAATTVPLGAVILDDASIEAVSFDPLTFVLAPGVAAPEKPDKFVVTLDGVRLYAGGVTVIESAKARHYPVITARDTGVAIYVVITPTLGSNHDSDLTLPAALADHFRARGPIQPGPRPVPRTTHRRFLAAVTSTKPGDPTSQIECACDGAGACTIALSFRRPGTAAPAWDQTETHDLPVAEFDAVWSLVESMNLFRLDPQPGRDTGAIHPPRYRVAVDATRAGGAHVELDREWQTPSVWDQTIEVYLKAVGALGTAHAQSVPVNYFPT